MVSKLDLFIYSLSKHWASSGRCKADLNLSPALQEFTVLGGVTDCPDSLEGATVAARART